MTQPYNARNWRSRYLEFSWNDYQKEIFRYLPTPEASHIQVCAVAGSGKTTTIFGIVAVLPSDAKILICAFNKHIADKIESDSRIPKGRVTASTAHAVGYGLLTKTFRGIQPTVEDNKYYQLAKKLYTHHLPQQHFEDLPAFPKFNEKIPKEREQLRGFFNYIRDVAEYAMLTLIPLEVNALLEMADYFSLEAPNRRGADFWGCSLALEAISLGETIAFEQKKICYAEMLYLPYRWDLPVPKKDWIIIDEAQDANATQRALYRKYVDAGAKAIFIGDDRQAIQGFAGADAYSWGSIKEEFKTIDKPLHLCYRCPTSHLELAQKIVPAIKPRPNAPLGKTEVTRVEKVLEIAEAGDLVICRLTAPLIRLCLKLILRGKYARVRGRNLGEQLTSLVRKAVDENQFVSFKSHLWSYCAPQIQKFLDEGEEGKSEALADRRDALNYCYDSFGAECKSLAEFCSKVEDLFSDVDEGIVLSTIHRAKGDEAERVFLLGSNLLPFLYKSSKEWQKVQEWNLTYVALTRAIKELYFVPILREKDGPEKLAEYLGHPQGGLQLPSGTDDAPSEVPHVPQPQPKLLPLSIPMEKSALAPLTLAPPAQVQVLPSPKKSQLASPPPVSEVAPFPRVGDLVYRQPCERYRERRLCQVEQVSSDGVFVRDSEGLIWNISGYAWRQRNFVPAISKD